MTRIATAVLAALLLLLAGCADQPGPGSGADPLTSPGPTAEPTDPATDPTDPATDPTDVSTVEDCTALGYPFGEAAMNDPGTPSPIPTPQVQVRGDEVAALGADLAAAHPDTWAGLLIDWRADQIVLQTTGDPEALLADARTRTDLAVRVRVVDHTEAELEQARAALDAALGQGDRPEGLSGYGDATGINRIAVDVLGDPAPTAQLLVDTGYADRFCLLVEPIPTQADAQPVDWVVDPAWTPDPTATEVPLLVTEAACNGGDLELERIVLRGVTAAPDRIEVDLAAIPPAGPQTCQGGPPTPYLLPLPEPLGDRPVGPAGS